jgi:DNA-binding MurR/RpiR family transcriptional regulator
MNSNNFSTTEINQKLSNGYVGFSKEVKKAAKYVMDNPAEIPLHSIRTVASNAGVNPSTMVRLINILGFKRYDEFKTIYKKAASQMPVSNFTSHAKDLLNENHNNPFTDAEANVYKSLSGAFNEKTYKAIDSSVEKVNESRNCLYSRNEKQLLHGILFALSFAFYSSKNKIDSRPRRNAT